MRSKALGQTTIFDEIAEKRKQARKEAMKEPEQQDLVGALDLVQPGSSSTASVVVPRRTKARRDAKLAIVMASHGSITIERPDVPPWTFNILFDAKESSSPFMEATVTNFTMLHTFVAIDLASKNIVKAQKEEVICTKPPRGERGNREYWEPRSKCWILKKVDKANRSGFRTVRRAGSDTSTTGMKLKRSVKRSLKRTRSVAGGFGRTKSSPASDVSDAHQGTAEAELCDDEDGTF